MKKILSVIILLLAVSMSAFALEITYNGINYSITSSDDKTVEVCGPWDYNGSELTIPEKVYYQHMEYTVTGIGYRAFFFNNSITSVSIPSTVKIIDENAFFNCINLTSCTFEAESELEQIGQYAFNYTGLSTIDIPATVKVIGDYAFSGCTNLTSCTFEAESQLEQIGVQAFYETNLTTIDIPVSVKTIGEYAFGKNAALKQVFIHCNEPSFCHSFAFLECSDDLIIYAPAAELYEAYKNHFFQNKVEVPIDIWREYAKPIIENGLKALNTLSDENRKAIDSYLATIDKTESFDAAYEAHQAAMSIINAQIDLEGKLKSAIGTIGTKQEGPTIEVMGNDGTVFKLYNIKNVKFGKESE